MEEPGTGQLRERRPRAAIHRSSRRLRAYRYGQGSKVALLLFLGGSGEHGKGAHTAIQVAVGQVQDELSQGQLVAVCEVEACGPHLIETGGWVRSTTRGRKPHPPAPPKPPRPN